MEGALRPRLFCRELLEMLGVHVDARRGTLRFLSRRPAPWALPSVRLDERWFSDLGSGAADAGMRRGGEGKGRGAVIR